MSRLRRFGQRIGANRLVVALSIARFGDAVGNGILLVLLPLYIARTAQPAWFPFSEEVRVGALLALFGAVTSVMQPVVGAWSDRMSRRRPLIELGLVVMALLTLAFAWTHTFTGLALLRALQGVGIALTIPTALSLMTTASHRRTRGGSMGIYTTMRMAGMAVGPLLGGVLQVYVGFDAAFYAGAGCIALALVIVRIWVVESPPDPSRNDARLRSSSSSRSYLSAGIVGAGVATFAMAAQIAMISTLEKQFNARLHQTAIGFSIAFSALTGSRLLTQVPLGWLSDRIGRKPLVIGGLLLLAPATVLIGWVATTAELTGLRLVQGVASAAIAAPAFALAGDLARRGSEAKQLSIVTTGFTLGVAVGPLMSGLMAASLPLASPFILGGALSLLAAWIVYRLVPETLVRDGSAGAE